MLIGYARVSKADGSQSLDLQRAALRRRGQREAENYAETYAHEIAEAEQEAVDTSL